MEEKTCPVCRGRRLNEKSLSCKVAGCSIDQMCAMEFTELVKVLQTIDDPRAATIVESLTASLTRMIEIGLPYLSMDRGGTAGGEIVFAGTPAEMAEHARTITAEYLRKAL